MGKGWIPLAPSLDKMLPGLVSLVRSSKDRDHLLSVPVYAGHLKLRTLERRLKPDVNEPLLQRRSGLLGQPRLGTGAFNNLFLR